MTRLILAAVLALLASSASAQTVEAVIDLNALGWGPLNAPQSVETDGDLSTTEWLISKPFSALRRVVAERDGGICAGEWFDPTQGGNALTPVAVQRFGLIHKLLVHAPSGVVKVSLDTPVCESQH